MRASVSETARLQPLVLPRRPLNLPALCCSCCVVFAAAHSFLLNWRGLYVRAPALSCTVSLCPARTCQGRTATADPCWTRSAAALIGLSWLLRRLGGRVSRGCVVVRRPGAVAYACGCRCPAPRRALRHDRPAPAPVAVRNERVHLWVGAAPEGSHGRPRCGCGGGGPPPCGCWPAARAPAPRHHPPAPAAAAQGQQGAAGEELRVCGGYAFPPSMFRQGDKGETALLLPFRSHLAVSAAWLLLRRCPFDCFVVLGSTRGATRESCVPRTVRVRIYHGARATALCAGAHGIVDDGARNLFRRHRL